MIEIAAILTKITTTVDGGWRVTLDLDDSFRSQIMQLASFKDKLLTAKFDTSQDSFDVVGIDDLISNSGS